MNWYKKAILVDKNTPNSGVPINTTCMYCGRWATHPDKDNPASQSEYIWKTPMDLNGVERVETEKAFNKENWISHGICPYCMNVLKTLGHWPEKEDFDVIKDRSLGQQSIISGAESKYAYL